MVRQMKSANGAKLKEAHATLEFLEYAQQARGNA
jgi:hypothetical protein